MPPRSADQARDDAAAAPAALAAAPAAAAHARAARRALLDAGRPPPRAAAPSGRSAAARRPSRSNGGGGGGGGVWRVGVAPAVASCHWQGAHRLTRRGTFLRGVPVGVGAAEVPMKVFAMKRQTEMRKRERPSARSRLERDERLVILDEQREDGGELRPHHEDRAEREADARDHVLPRDEEEEEDEQLAERPRERVALADRHALGRPKRAARQAPSCDASSAGRPGSAAGCAEESMASRSAQFEPPHRHLPPSRAPEASRLRAGRARRWRARRRLPSCARNRG